MVPGPPPLQAVLLPGGGSGGRGKEGGNWGGGARGGGSNQRLSLFSAASAHPWNSIQFQNPSFWTVFAQIVLNLNSG